MVFATYGLQHARLSCPSPSPSLPKFISIESVIPSNHLILCCLLLLLHSVFPSIRVFSNESAVHIRWPKYWCFSFSNSPSSEYSELISFRKSVDIKKGRQALDLWKRWHRLCCPVIQHSKWPNIGQSWSWVHYSSTGFYPVWKVLMESHSWAAQIGFMYEWISDAGPLIQDLFQEPNSQRKSEKRKNPPRLCSPLAHNYFPFDLWNIHQI